MVLRLARITDKPPWRGCDGVEPVCEYKQKTREGGKEREEKKEKKRKDLVRWWNTTFSKAGHGIGRGPRGRDNTLHCRSRSLYRLTGAVFSKALYREGG